MTEIKPPFKLEGNLASNSMDSQVTVNESSTVKQGHSIVASSFGDNAHLVYNNNVTVNNPQSIPVKELISSCFYGVPTENHACVNRLNMLASIDTAFSKSSSGGCKILALRGLGGMGKTQLMLQYCYLHRDQYDFVFWLEIDSWNTTIDSFRKLAIELGFEEYLKGKDSDEKIIRWVSSWLQKRTKWLLLLDNGDDDDTVKKLLEFLPRIGGDIILTTRSYISLQMAKVVSVDKMQEDEALFLLFGVSSMDLIEQNSRKLHCAREIVIELDFMPLAIDLARSYISNTLISFQNYLSMFKDNKKRISLLQYNDEDDFGHYKYNVATVWQLSFERIRALNPATVQILKACAFLQPEAIPVSLFKRQYPILELVPPIPAVSINQDSEQSWEAIGKAIAVLVKFSFLKKTSQEAEDGAESPTSDSLTIHRLVQKVMYDTMNNEQRLRWAYNIATALNNSTHYDDSAIYAPRTRTIMHTYLSHIRHFATLLDDLSQKPLISRDLSKLLDREISYLIQYGTYSGIEELAQYSIRVSEAAYGLEHEGIVTSLSNQVELYLLQAKYDQAEPLCKQALAIRGKELGPEHPNTASLLNKLAKIYDSQGKSDAAEVLYKRALAIHEKALGAEHLETTKLLNNLALFYNYRGKYDEAEPLFQRVLVIREKALGSEHPDTATTLDNLAGLYSDLGKYDEAEPLYNRALAIREKTLGSEHPRTAASLNNLADLRQTQGKYGEAEPLCKRVLTICEKVFGEEHPHMATALNDLARLYKCQGKYNEAEPLYTQALAIREKILGSEHPRTATSLNDLAGLYSRQGNYDEAGRLYKRALVIREKALGSEHPDTASSLDNLATFYDSQGKHDEAEPLYKQALVIRKKVLGLEHPHMATSLSNLAGVYVRQGKYDEAEKLYKRAVVIREKTLGVEHSDTAQLLNNLATLYVCWGKYDEAEPLYKQALAVQERALGLEHSDTTTSMHHLAMLYDTWGKYEQAEPLYKQVLVIQENMMGPGHPHTLRIINALVYLHQKSKRISSAYFIDILVHRIQVPEFFAGVCTLIIILVAVILFSKFIISDRVPFVKLEQGQLSI